jgi:mono/diheme cytochrome c family protein
MPYRNYGKMDREDLYSIIAYIRSLAPIVHVVEPSVSDFPMNFIIHTIPQKAEFGTLPSTNDILARGAYLFNAASCNACHSKEEKGEKIKGLELAGGFEFPMPTGGVVRSANITPDKETGIGNWTETAFLQRFKLYSDSSYKNPTIGKGDFNSVMPWTMYTKMDEADLKAIYAYLKTVKPVKNTVVKFSN